MGRQVTAVYRYKRMDSGKENKSKFKSVSSRILTDWKAMVMMYEQAVVLEEYLRGKLVSNK